MIKDSCSNLIDFWVLKKTKEKTNIYILPTKAGLSYISTNFLIFLVGLTYANNAVLLISFILVSFFIMIMIRSHFYTDSIKLGQLNLEPGHSDTGVKCSLKSKSKHAPTDFSIFLPKSKKEVFNNKNESNFIKNLKRGSYSFSYYRLESKGPIGLFKTWRYIKKPFSFFIYPQKKEDLETKKLIDTIINIEHSSEYQDHIPFEKGMSPKNIDWKRYSKDENLLIKRYTGLHPIEIDIDYKKIKGDHETKVSKMSWIISYCLKNSISWSLKVHKWEMLSQSSVEDYHRCNERLAIYE